MYQFTNLQRGEANMDQNSNWTQATTRHWQAKDWSLGTMKSNYSLYQHGHKPQVLLVPNRVGVKNV